MGDWKIEGLDSDTQSQSIRRQKAWEQAAAYAETGSILPNREELLKDFRKINDIENKVESLRAGMFQLNRENNDGRLKRKQRYEDNSHEQHNKKQSTDDKKRLTIAITSAAQAVLTAGVGAPTVMQTFTNSALTTPLMQATEKAVDGANRMLSTKYETEKEEHQYHLGRYQDLSSNYKRESQEDDQMYKEIERAREEESRSHDQAVNSVLGS